MKTQTQIIATIGPSSADRKILLEMLENGLDMVRLNMSWGNFPEHHGYIADIRELAKSLGRTVPIILDLPGPRVQKTGFHFFNSVAKDAITKTDKEIMEFGVKEGVEFFAVSYVGGAEDISEARKILVDLGSQQKLIAKIERKQAVDNFPEILQVADMIMVARGDLGNELPLEKIPFVEEQIIRLCNKSKKPVIVATQMMLSMVENSSPTRAEVTDVAYAVILGSNAVMLSDETAKGKFPVEAIKQMDAILKEAELHVSDTQIMNLFAREILDSRGNPTVQVTCELSGGGVGEASVPSGASTGKYEAYELRDEDSDRYAGQGVQRAVENVKGEIFSAVKEKSFDQSMLDEFLIKLDGTKNKSRLGANAILGVSLSFARAVAKQKRVELFEYIGGLVGNQKFTIPTPMFNIINGGKHADSGLEVQEFMVCPVGLPDFGSRLMAGSKITHTLKKLLKEKGYSTGVGDEGGFAPALGANEKALEIIQEAIEKSGYSGDQVKVAMDVAASSFFIDGKYKLKIQGAERELDSKELIAWYESLVSKYNIFSIEDCLEENDFAGFAELKNLTSNKIMMVGDDLTVTNVTRIKQAQEAGSINAVLIKLNQIGTLTETLQAIEMTKSFGWQPVISHRSGETSDTFISDLAVGVGANFIKTGAPVRGERVAKYNRLLEIDQVVNSQE